MKFDNDNTSDDTQPADTGSSTGWIDQPLQPSARTVAGEDERHRRFLAARADRMRRGITHC